MTSSLDVRELSQVRLERDCPRLPSGGGPVASSDVLAPLPAEDGRGGLGGSSPRGAGEADPPPVGLRRRGLEGRQGARRTEPPNAAVKVGRCPSDRLPSALEPLGNFRPVIHNNNNKIDRVQDICIYR